MVYYALHGDWLRSFFSNPFLFLLGIYLAVAIVLYHITCFSGKPVHRWFVNTKWLWFWAASAVGFMILRNLPYWPFTFLAPEAFRAFRS